MNARRAFLCAAIWMALAFQATAATFVYNRTSSNTSGTADQWSAGTNWNATPISGIDTILTFGNGASLAAGAAIFSNNNIAGDFKLNMLNFNYAGPASGSPPTVTISGNRLEFINNGGAAPVLNLNAAAGVSPLLTVSNDLLLTNDSTVAGSSNAVLSGVISGTGMLTRTGPVANTGALTLSGSSTFSGGVTLTRGTLFINNGGTSATNSALGTGTFTINGDTSVIANRSGQPVTVLTNNAQVWGATLHFDAGGGAPSINSLNLGTGAVTLTGNRELDIGGLDGFFAATTFTVGGAISDGGSGFSLTKTGLGTLVLTGTSTYSGGTTIAGGGINVATIGNAGAAGSLGTGSITINTNSTLRYIGAGETTNKVLNYGGSSMQLDAAGTGPVNFTADMTATSAGDKTLVLRGSPGEISGHIIDYGAGNKTSVFVSGDWTLSGANTYSGQTTIDAGTLSVASLNSVVGGVASSNLGAPTTVADGAIGFGPAGTIVPTLKYTGSGETTDRVVSLSGSFLGGRIAQEGTGLLKFTSDLIPGMGISGGDRDLFLAGSTSGTGEFAGVISGAGGVAKEGTGTWTLSGANTYTRTTTVFQGTLLINGNQSAATGTTTVNNVLGTNVQAVLGGTGTIGGAVVVSGGKITAAAEGSVGVLTINGNATFVGAFICPECDGAASAPLTSSPSAEFVLATYAVDISGALSDKLVIGGTLDLSDANDRIILNGTPDGTTTYVLATYSAVTGTFNNANTPAGYELFYGTNEVDLRPVPEPGTVALIAIGMLSVAALYERRRRSLTAATIPR